MNKAIRILQVGVGGVGKRRISLLNERDDVVVVGAVDPSAKAREAAHELGVESLFETLDEALAQLQPDAVVVSTPHGLHQAQVTACLDAGAHVLCEKPMGIGAQEAQRLLKAADRANRRLAMARNHLYLPSVTRALTLISDGKIGALTDITAEVGHGRGDDLPPWHHRAAQAGGGCLRDNGAHPLLICERLWGIDGDRPAHVQMLRSEALNKGEAAVEAEVEATVHSVKGRTLKLKVSWKLEVGYRLTLTLRGEQGEIEIDGPVGLSWRRRDEPWQVVEVVDAGPMESWRQDTEAFLTLMETRQGPAAGSARAGLWTAEVTDALYRSLKSGATQEMSGLDRQHS